MNIKTQTKIKKFGEFAELQIKGSEVLGLRMGNGWVHICYLKDVSEYLSGNHYNSPK